MAYRTSLRKKLAFTFLAGALITVVLFSLVIKGIVNDYFNRQSAARLTFVEEQGKQAVRANLLVFKDRIQQSFAAGAAGLTAMCRSGVLGDHLEHLPKSAVERKDTAKILQALQSQARLSFITVVDLDGKVVVRSTNPAKYGDDTLIRDYENPGGPVSSIHHLVQTALKGQTVTSFEAIAPEVLEPENAVENDKIISSLKDFAAVPLKGHNIPPDSQETRALTLTMAAPVLKTDGKTVGAVIAGRVLNKDESIVQDVRDLLQDQATIFLGQVRVATTRRTADNTIGTVHSGTAPSGGKYVEREPRGIDGEQTMGVFDPIRDHQNTAIGSLYIGRPLASLDSITTAQQQIEAAVERRTNLYIFALAIASMVIAVVIASIFSRRITEQIDQLRKGAEVISDGNLDYRLKIESGDEIELLAQQFNSMAGKLQESHQTLEKKVEERTRELKESQEAMVQQEKMVGIGQLAAGIAHELNTPLGTIIGYAQMLREDLSMQPSVNGNLNDVDEIVEQAGRCRDLVKNLLNFSRRSTTEKSPTDINAMVRKILSLVEHDFDMKGVRVEMDLNENLPQATVNENEIAQVVLNLANNAVDSMPNGGILSVVTAFEESTDRVRIEVHDTGSGISDSDRNRVFEPFFTTKEVGKGTGLGLSICYKIVENHLGSMEFDSVIGEGTTFRVFLPVHAEVRVV